MSGWIAQGKRVVGPRLIASPIEPARDGRVLYAPLQSSDQLALEGFIHPAIDRQLNTIESPQELVLQARDALDNLTRFRDACQRAVCQNLRLR